jgi:murein DD-endopeptidase MepM/ murein hydrolase activator NlpD
MSAETEEKNSEIQKSPIEKTTPEAQETIQDTKQQLAEMYLDFLDKQKWGILATGAGLGINLNPLKKNAIEFLTTETTVKEKKDIFSTIGKNIKKKFIEKFTWWTMLEYDKTSLNKMKALITQYKDDQTKLQALMTQIEEGVDPTVVALATTTAVATAATIADKPVVPDIATKAEYQAPFDAAVKNLTITSGFGLRTNPVTWEKDSPHYWMDLSAALWTPIHPIENGKVIANTRDKDAGNMITITSEDWRTFSYLHMKEASIYKVGEQVTTKDVIGNIGSTGKSTWPHLHLAEKNKDGEFVNPLADEKIAPLFKEYKNYDTLADSEIKTQDDMKTA